MPMGSGHEFQYEPLISWCLFVVPKADARCSLGFVHHRQRHERNGLARLNSDGSLDNTSIRQ